MYSVLRRGFDALRSLLRWYSTPTGLLVVLASVAAVVLALQFESPVPIIVAAIFLVLIVFPWKMSRSQRSLNDLKTQLMARAAATEEAARDQAEKTRNLVQNERRNYLSSLETARSEWADILSSERLMRDAEELRMAAQYEDALAQLAKLEAELDELRNTVGDVADQIPVVQAKSTEGVEVQLRKSEQQIINRVDGRLRTERSARLLETARLRAGLARPDQMLVILTPQRTGSTLLMDAFRSYPGVGMWPTSRYFGLLGADGRRYPGDLSPDAGTGEVTEVQPGVGGIVPAPPASWDAERSLGIPKVALEKIHPMVIDFDPRQMIDRVRRLTDEGIDVKIVYQLRDPVDSIRSFLAYQQRAERWHPDMSGSDVVAQYLASYTMMDALMTQTPGPVVSYPEFSQSPDALAAVYEAVFDADAGSALQLAAEVLAVASPEARKATQKGPFVDSDRAGIPARAQILLGWPEGDQAAKDQIDDLMTVYQRLAARTIVRSAG